MSEINYIPLHIRIARCNHCEGDNYSVQILPPLVPFRTFRDINYQWPLYGGIPDYVKELGAQVNEAVENSQEVRSENGPYFSMIKECGSWLDDEISGIEPGELINYIRFCINILELDQSKGLLILLHFSEDASELADLMWETWNYRANNVQNFLITQDRISLVRYVPSLGSRQYRQEGNQKPLKVLAGFSSFDHDGRIDPCQLEFLPYEETSLTTGLSELISKGMIDLEIKRNPSGRELKEAIQDADVYHHFGHGYLSDDGEAFITLKDDVGPQGVMLSWQNMHKIFDQKNAEKLKLVVLNSCKLQKGGLGSNLARIGVPAVVGMQAEIGTDVVSIKGFTQKFYTQLSAGLPVHAAFSKARAGIWSSENAVEPFIPVLILSTTEDVSLTVDQERAKQVLRDSERTPDDPFAQWREAAMNYVESGNFENALSALRVIENGLPDHPHLKDKYRDLEEEIKELEAKVDQRKRVDSLISQIETAIGRYDYSGIHLTVREVKPLIRNLNMQANLSGRIEICVHNLQNELSRLRSENNWIHAKQACFALEAIIELLPEEKQFNVSCYDIVQRAERQIAELMEKLKKLDREGDFGSLAQEAQRYLQADPYNKEVRDLLYKAEKNLAQEAPTKAAEAADARLKGKLDSANKAQADGDWEKVKAIGREIQSADPGNREAVELLKDALIKEAKSFQKAGRLEEAEANCQELLDGIAPGWKDAVTLMGNILLAQAKKAKGERNWETVRDKSRSVLENPQMTNLHVNAKKMMDQAEETLDMLKRIKVL